MKTLLIIPAFNEEESLPFLIEELKKFPLYNYLVINDCSSDKTKEFLILNNINHINLPINLGLNGAVQTGMKYAFEKGYDFAVQIDADGQHKIKEVKKIIEGLKEGNNIVIGSRFLENDSYNQKSLRKIGANYISFLIKLFSGLVIKDPTSGMRGFSLELIKYMSSAVNERFEPDSLLYSHKKNFKIKEVSVKMRERQAGKSYLTFFRSLHYMVDVTISFFWIFLRVRKEKFVKND